MNKQILIVEDDKFIARAYKDGLEKLGFQVEVVYDGDQAIEYLSDHTPGLILLDLIIPGADGFAVIKQVRQVLKNQQLPILVLSNLSQDSDIQSAISLGATEYLTKVNHSMQEVVEKINKYLKN